MTSGKLSVQFVTTHLVIMSKLSLFYGVFTMQRKFCLFLFLALASCLSLHAYNLITVCAGSLYAGQRAFHRYAFDGWATCLGANGEHIGDGITWITFVK